MLRPSLVSRLVAFMVATSVPALASAAPTPAKSSSTSPDLRVDGLGEGGVAFPLSTVTAVASGGAAITVYDGDGRRYVHTSLSTRAVDGSARVPFTVGGALGTHVVLLEDETGRTLASIGFAVDARTEIADEPLSKGQPGEFARLLDTLVETMGRRVGHTRLFGRDHEFFVSWIRDHVHTLKGMKYFHPELRSGIDLYRVTQRKDGMIWDNHETVQPFLNHWDMRFAKNGFVARYDDGRVQFRRIPVEADVEYLYVEGVYFTWKATGDDAWMKAALPSAVKALEHSLHDPLRWSKKHGLVKRGFTIDTWDFQHAEDAALMDGDVMMIDGKKTRFGIMHGDNTGLFASLRLLAEMLDRAGRAQDAARYRRLADEVQKRTTEVAWNGRFFRHHVAEDPATKRDFGGTDPDAQLSLSNAYSANRGLTHDQVVSIVRAYQDIAKALPEGSPGEWYGIYPPFEKGFGGAAAPWHYVNGGVLTCVAGELAHAAFEHGEEAYGVDVLRRLGRIGAQKGGYLPAILRGKTTPAKTPTFTTVSLAGVANRDVRGTAKAGAPSWTDDGANDLHELPIGNRKLKGVPFDIADPLRTSGRVAIGLHVPQETDGGGDPQGWLREATVPVGRKAGSMYLLHAVTRGAGPIGTVTFEYEGGGRSTRTVIAGEHVLHWWYPQQPMDHDDEGGGRPHKASSDVQVGWVGKNAKAQSVGVTLWRIDNPHPDRVIARVQLAALPSRAKWLVVGLTTSDVPLDFAPSNTLGGMPNEWGAAAVVYALVEGLAGVKDTGVAFDRAAVTPRWTLAGVPRASVTIRYPASRGYVAYRWARDPRSGEQTLELTGNAGEIAVSLPVTTGRDGTLSDGSLSIDGAEVRGEPHEIERSRYVRTTVTGPGVHKLVLKP